MCACLLVACYSPVAYVPSDSLNAENSVKILERLLREHQPQEYNVEEVDVTGEYFRIAYSQIKNTKFIFANTGITSVAGSKFVYFDNIGRIRILHRSLYLVAIYDKAGAEVFKYVTNQHEKAQLFASAILTLSSLDPNRLNGD